MSLSKQTTAKLALLGTALCYASMGILVKFLSAEFTPFLQTFLRLVVSGLLTFILVNFNREKITIKSRQNLLPLLIMGTFGYGISIMTFTMAFNYTPIANVVFILSAYPIFTALLSPVILKEKLTPSIIGTLIILVIALFLMFNPQNLQKNLAGNLLALAASVTFAVYVVLSRMLTQRGNSASIITLFSVFLAMLTSLVATILFEPIQLSFSAAGIIGIILFGFINFAGYNLLNFGFKRIQAVPGTMILLLEPIIGSVLGYIFFHELPGFSFVFGALLLITAIMISAVSQSKPS